MKTKTSNPFSWVFIGNILEHYDTALYGLLSPLFASLFLAHLEPIEGLIFAYALIPIGMLMRPLGAIIFGRIGDGQGRERALVLSMLGMGAASLTMALLPIDYPLVAVILIIVARAIQNVCIAGENMNGAIYLLEKTHQEKQDQISGLYAVSHVLGSILASFSVYLCYASGTISSLFRLLYFVGGILAIVAAFFRKCFPKTMTRQPQKQPPILQILIEEKKPITSIAITAGFSYAIYSACFILINGLAPLISQVSLESMLMANTFLLGLDIILLPFFGWIASLITREKLMRGASLLIFFLAIPIFAGFQDASLLSICLLRSLLITLGVAFCAPWHAWAQTLVAPSRRCLVISFGYAIGALCIGGLFAPFSLWIYGKLGFPASIGIPLSILGGAVFLLFSAVKKRVRAY